MALSDAQKADVRRYAGYPSLGDTVADDSRDFAYSFVSPGVWNTLFHRLNTMRPEEEAVLVNVYLTNLTTLEAAIPAAGENLDTDQAAVWKRNKSEVDERVALFNRWRRQMCNFIGIAPGPTLGDGTMRLVRG